MSTKNNCTLCLQIVASMSFREFSNGTAGKKGGRTVIALCDGTLLPAPAKLLHPEYRACEHTRWGCWNYFSLVHTSQVHINVPWPQHAHKPSPWDFTAWSWGSISSLGISAPLIFRKFIFWGFHPDWLPSSLASILQWHVAERTVPLHLTQAKQCACIADWHFQVQVKCFFFVCSHPWLFLPHLFYFMLSEMFILPLLDWDCVVCWFFFFFMLLSILEFTNLKFEMVWK